MKSLYLIIFTFAFSLYTEAAQKVTSELLIYSSRKEHLIKPVFDAYFKETGVKINYLTDKEAPLIAKLKAEGKATKADIFMTVDAGNLWFAEKEGLFDTVNSKVLDKNIPSNLKNNQNKWFAFSKRARTIVYDSRKLKPSDLSTYEDLGTEKFKGKLCLRTSKKVYNQSLVAMMIETMGQKKAQKIVESWVENLAAPVFTSDTKLIQAIEAGQCDVGIVNTYYLGRLQKENKNYPVKIFWPNQLDRGVHVNVSGAGLLKHSKNKKVAINFLEWLSSPLAQKLFAELNLEFPVVENVAVHEIVKKWGRFKSESAPVAKAGSRQVESIKLMKKAGYN